MKTALLLAYSLVVIFGLPITAKATPEITQYGIGCTDGLCLWVKGRDLFRSTNDHSRENRYDYIYIDVYADADAAKDDRLARYFISDFLSTRTTDEGIQILSLKFEEPVVREQMMKSGIYFRIVNPESKSQKKWTERVFLPWNRNALILSEDFQTVPLTNRGTWGIPRATLRDRKSFNPAANSKLGWFNTSHGQASRIHASSDGNRYLVTRTEKGKFGIPKWERGGGMAVTSNFCQTPPCEVVCEKATCRTDEKPAMISKGFEEAILSYKVNFANCPGSQEEFDFKKGGKLPGLGGGRGGAASGGGNGGGGPSGRNGWSSRTMWGSMMNATLYLYHPDMRNPSVIPVPKGGNEAIYHRKDLANRPGTMIYGHGFPYLNDDGSRFIFERNRWYLIEQRVRMNSVSSDTAKGNHDGEIEILVDGKRKLLVQNIRLRHGKKFKTGSNDEMPKLLDIDSLAFHNFFGGNQDKYAPRTDSCVAFDNVRVFEPIR